MRQFPVSDMIVYEDDQLLVCRKPAGLAVQTARLGEPDLENKLKTYLAGKDPGRLPYLAVIHRLDQPVEGLLLFAKTPSAAKELNRQLLSGEIHKEYLAVTDQCPPKEEGRLEDFLKKDGKSHVSAVVPRGTPGAKTARLTYRLAASAPDQKVGSGTCYLLQIRLETGRHHQIRVQMSHARMPLVGDRKYYPQDRSGYPLGLCAAGLSFLHPESKDRMSFEIVPAGACFHMSDRTQCPPDGNK